MSTHKHRKGFRKDQVVLSEAYEGVYNEQAMPKAVEKGMVPYKVKHGKAWVQPGSRHPHLGPEGFVPTSQRGIKKGLPHITYDPDAAKLRDKQFAKKTAAAAAKKTAAARTAAAPAAGGIPDWAKYAGTAAGGIGAGVLAHKMLSKDKDKDEDKDEDIDDIDDDKDNDEDEEIINELLHLLPFVVGGYGVKKAYDAGKAGIETKINTFRDEQTDKARDEIIRKTAPYAAAGIGLAGLAGYAGSKLGKKKKKDDEDEDNGEDQETPAGVDHEAHVWPDRGSGGQTAFARKYGKPNPDPKIMPGTYRGTYTDPVDLPAVYGGDSGRQLSFGSSIHHDPRSAQYKGGTPRGPTKPDLETEPLAKQFQRAPGPTAKKMLGTAAKYSPIGLAGQGLDKVRHHVRTNPGVKEVGQKLYQGLPSQQEKRRNKAAWEKIKSSPIGKHVGGKLKKGADAYAAGIDSAYGTHREETSHKHRKGFRRDQQMLGETYGSMYNESAEDFEIPTGLGVSPGTFMQIEDQEEDGGDAKVKAYKKFLHDFRRFSVAQDPVRPSEYGLTDEDVRRFKELGIQEDEEREDNEDLDLTVDAGMSPQDKREAGEY